MSVSSFPINKCMRIDELGLLGPVKPKEIIAHQSNPDGSITTLFADETEYTYKDSKQFEKAKKRATQMLADKLGSKQLQFVKGLGKYKLWGPVAALEIAEAIVDADTYAADPRNFWKNVTSVTLVVTVNLVISGIKAGKIGGELIAWAFRLRSGKAAVSALAAAAVVPVGGWAAALAGIGAWAVLEFAIWYATDKVAEWIVSSFWDDDEAEAELKRTLGQEILYAVGMHNIKISPAKTDNKDFKSVASQVDKKDIEKIANVSKDELEKIAKDNPEMQDLISKKLGPQRKNIRQTVGAEESISESKSSKKFSDFIQHLEKNYNKKTANKVKKYVIQKVKKN